MHAEGMGILALLLLALVGFSGALPDRTPAPPGTSSDCRSCDPCFRTWDRDAEALGARVAELRDRAKVMITAGSVGSAWSHEHAFLAAERDLQTARGILDACPASQGDDGAAAERVADAARRNRELAERVRSRKREADGTMSALSSRRNNIEGDLDRLELSALRANGTAARAARTLTAITNSDFRGAYENIRSAFRDSQMAAGRVRDAIEMPGGAVQESRAVRGRAEALIRLEGRDFERRAAALAASVDAIDGIGGAGGLIARINEKVCGSPGHAPCSTAPCGGGGCRDADTGLRRCGGSAACQGAAPVAERALDGARRAQQETDDAGRKADLLSRTVEDVKRGADEAKETARALADRAGRAGNDTRRSIADVRALLAGIRRFLSEDGVEPGSVERVASEVLRITLPASEGNAEQLMADIRASVGRLASVEQVLIETRRGMDKARRLSQEATAAREAAEKVGGRTDGVRDALAEAQRALELARRSDVRVTDELEAAQRIFNQVDERVEEAAARLPGLATSLQTLSSGAGQLESETGRARLQAAAASRAAAAAAAGVAASADLPALRSLMDRFRAEAAARSGAGGGTATGGAGGGTATGGGGGGTATGGGGGTATGGGGGTATGGGAGGGTATGGGGTATGGAGGGTATGGGAATGGGSSGTSSGSSGGAGGGDGGSPLQRALALQQKAAALLGAARDGSQRVQSLEQDLAAGQEILARRSQSLVGLEEKAVLLREAINSKVQLYFTCTG